MPGCLQNWHCFCCRECHAVYKTGIASAGGGAIVPTRLTLSLLQEEPWYLQGCHCLYCRRCHDACKTGAASAEGGTIVPSRLVLFLLEVPGCLRPDWHCWYFSKSRARRLLKLTSAGGGPLCSLHPVGRQQRHLCFPTGAGSTPVRHLSSHYRL